jgi:activator of 2-hydroxyglutaryl-CoA dehydratase
VYARKIAYCLGIDFGSVIIAKKYVAIETTFRAVSFQTVFLHEQVSMKKENQAARILAEIRTKHLLNKIRTVTATGICSLI